jgi:hypothetical protein
VLEVAEGNRKLGQALPVAEDLQALAPEALAHLRQGAADPDPVSIPAQQKLRLRRRPFVGVPSLPCTNVFKTTHRHNGSSACAALEISGWRNTGLRLRKTLNQVSAP